MGLVAYRDIGDDYVTKKFDLTTDIQDLYADLLQLRAQRRRRLAGKRQRGALRRRHQAVLEPRAGTPRRIMFLVGDAPPHMDYAQDTKYPEVHAAGARSAASPSTPCRPAARATPSGCGARSPRWATANTSRSRRTAARWSIIETPYDRDIIELQGQINGTVIPYGPRQQREQRRADDRGSTARRPRPVASEMAGYMSNNAPRRTANADAITGGGDLRRRRESGPQDAVVGEGRGVAGRHAPHVAEPNGRRMSSSKWTERTTLNDRMTDLVKKRDGYVVEQRKKTARARSRLVRPRGGEDTADADREVRPNDITTCWKSRRGQTA